MSSTFDENRPAFFLSIRKWSFGLTKNKKKLIPEDPVFSSRYYLRGKKRVLMGPGTNCCQKIFENFLTEKIKKGILNRDKLPKRSFLKFVL